MPFPGELKDAVDVWRIVYQCVVCGCVEDERPPRCVKCGCKMFRETTMEQLDNINPEAIAHLMTENAKKRMECPNYLENPKTRIRKYHKLEIEKIVDVSHVLKDRLEHPRSFVRVTDKCKTCHRIMFVNQIPTTRPDVLKELHLEKELEGLMDLNKAVML